LHLVPVVPARLESPLGRSESVWNNRKRNGMKRIGIFFVTALVLTWSLPAPAQTVWVEGENPATSDVKRHPWWYDKVLTGEFSQSKYLSNWSDEVGTALYRVRIPEDGKYDFYLRINPSGSLAFRIDLGKWQRLDMSKAGERRNVADDGEIDLRFLAWIKAGTYDLEKGKITLQIKLDSKNNNHGYIDAMMFTAEGKVPEGTKAVDGKWKLAPAASEIKKETSDSSSREPRPRAHTVGERGTWEFAPAPDPFRDEALLDLRFLNEETSGQSGFCKLSEDGASIVRGDGKKMRFWATVGGLDHRRRGKDGPEVRHSPEQIATYWRFLAKRGVNLVRLHKTVAPTWKGAKIDEVDEIEIDNIWRSIKGAKDNGIYIVLSPLYAHFRVPASWGLEGYEPDKAMPWQAVMVDEKMKSAYKTWIKALYTRKNPYTGLAIKDDPTVAVLQVHNEDGLFFWTFQSLPDPQRRMLGKAFGTWLKRKYGSIEQALNAWGGQEQPGDKPAAGVVDMIGKAMAWEMVQDLQGAKAQRMRDQIEFLARYQRDFYQQIDTYIKEELGCKQLTNAGNWYTADDARLLDLERWTYLAMDVLAKNNYAGVGVHVGAKRGYRIDPGHYIRNESALLRPEAIPTSVKQVAGRPFLVTESTWVNPNLYQAEGPFLVAAYQSLNGLDAFHWFATAEETWQKDPRRKFWPVVRGNEAGYAMSKWSCSTPPLLGMFPANALTCRLGYLKEGEPAVEEHRWLEDLFQRKPGAIGEDKGFDPNVETRGAGSAQKGISPLAYLVGPVQVHYDSDPEQTQVANLSNYIDAENRVVTSNTDQIRLDWGKGVATINSPKSQGVAGFLKAAGGEFKLPAVKIVSENEYATVQVVSMDDKPIIASGKLLIQVGTTARLTGWSTEPATFQKDKEPIKGEKILLTGKPPYRVAETKVTLRITNSQATRATLLDPNGYRTMDVTMDRQFAEVYIELPRNAMYVILH
jgi:hypothetical protein